MNLSYSTRMKVVIAGGSGFVGTALIQALLDRGDRVVLLTRRAAKGGRWGGQVETREWDGRSDGPWTKALDGADAVLNFSGESVLSRWTPARKLALTRSRVDSTRALVAAMAKAASRPKTLMNASAVGYYGASARGAHEGSPQGRDFLAALCGQWEREAYAAEALGARVVALRLGVVLGRGGGAIPKMRAPFLMFLGGPIGAGTQPYPWIHVDDVAGAALHLLDRPELSGAYNLTAPERVDNARFSAAFARSLGRPSWLAAPAFALRLLLGEAAEALLLDSPDAEPRRLSEAGYAFRHPRLDEALESLA